MSIGTRTKEERERLGLSQAELAKRVGGTATQAHINQLERGKTRQPRYLSALARALGVNREWLETGREPKCPPGYRPESLMQPANESAKANSVVSTGDGVDNAFPGRAKMNPVERKVIKALVDAYGPLAVIEETTKAASTTEESEHRPFTKRGK